MMEFMNGKGGADKEAAQLKKQILNADDNLQITGTGYYFSEHGSDDNDGLSPEAPFRSIKKLEWLPLMPGDGVFFERGSLFRISDTIYPICGVKYGAYGVGDKPIISGSARDYADESLWEYVNVRNIWRLKTPLPSDAGAVVINGGEYACWKHIFRSELREEFDFWCDDKYSVYLYCDENPGKRYNSIEISPKMTLMCFPKRSHDIVIDNIAFTLAGAHGIGSEGKVHDISVTNCFLSWIGGTIQGDPNNPIIMFGNAIEFWDSSENILVENNYCHQIYDTGITFQGHGPFRNITFRRNLIDYTEMSIEFWNMLHHEDVIGIRIEENIIQYTGYGWGRKRIGEGRAAHLWVGYTPTDYANLEVSIRNNIFDCCASFLFKIPWKHYRPSAQRYTFEGNTYYQCDKTGKNNYGFSDGYGNSAFLVGVAEEGKVPNFASNQKEFEEAVATIEKHPKLVRWLDT